MKLDALQAPHRVRRVAVKLDVADREHFKAYKKLPPENKKSQ